MSTVCLCSLQSFLRASLTPRVSGERPRTAVGGPPRPVRYLDTPHLTFIVDLNGGLP